ncbi:Wzz/FepE/Etk N-terminal domain-containing protein [Streptomyces sp. O3]
MSDDTIRLATLGRLIRRRWRFLTVVAVLGALVGYGVSVLFPPRYTASASVLLPGAWEARELRTQAEIASSSVVVERAAAALGWTAVSDRELRDRVSAEAAEGNFVKVSGTAETPERAQRLSDQVVQQYITFAARIVDDETDPEAAARPETLRQLVTRTSRRITELADAAGPGRTVEDVQTHAELAKLRTALQEAVNKLDQADPAAARTTMVVMGPAARPSGAAPPTRTHLAAAGALLFVLLAVIGQLAAARTGRRPRTEPEIAAALGSTPLGTVDVPGERRALRPEGRGPRARIRWLLGVDVPWDVSAPRTSGDEDSRRIRYQRVCARLRDRLPTPRPPLVVVPDDDRIARQAAERLAAEAGSDPSPRVVEVSASQPTVPDRDDESGVLVVLSAGVRTADELAGLADACADAGHELVGVVLTGTVRTRAAQPADRTREAATPAPLAVGGGATGGAE